MSEYFLFAGRRFYPKGGLNDLQGVYPSLQEANDAISTVIIWYDYDPVDEVRIGEHPGWAHVATFEDGKLIVLTTWSDLPASFHPVHREKVSRIED